MLSAATRRFTQTVLPLTSKIGNCFSGSFFSPDMPEGVLIAEPSSTHQASLIFLHGLGDTAHGWFDVMKNELSMDNVRFICPNAPITAVTLNMGMRMPAWYDIVSLHEFDKEDEAGIKSSAAVVHKLIAAEEEKGIPSEKIFVGGFSQGGAVALYAGLTYKNKLGGIIGLSCYLPLHTQFPGAVTANRSIPVVLGHGTLDNIVRYSFGEMTCTKIKLFNPNVELKTYPGMEHSSCPQELADVKRFLSSLI